MTRFLAELGLFVLFGGAILVASALAYLLAWGVVIALARYRVERAMRRKDAEP